MWQPVPIIPGEVGPIPLVDLAVRMGRTPRFGAAFRVPWWSVLHHSVCMDDAVFAAGRRAGRKLLLERRLYALIHDAHEAATGDVPSPWKNEMIRQAQHALTMRIYRATLGVEYPHHSVVEYVKQIDVLMMHAEGLSVGPTYWKTLYPLVSTTPRLEEIVTQVQKQYPRYDLGSEPNSPLVDQYMAAVKEVMSGLLLDSSCTN